MKTKKKLKIRAIFWAFGILFFAFNTYEAHERSLKCTYAPGKMPCEVNFMGVIQGPPEVLVTIPLMIGCFISFLYSVWRWRRVEKKD